MGSGEADAFDRHRWCRETGSSAMVCLSCGSCYDHGVIRANENIDKGDLATFASWCHCNREDDPSEPCEAPTL